MKVKKNLDSCFQREIPEAGCDEAGRGCYAGPVFAAAVILPPDFFHPLLNDSKLVSAKIRQELRIHIEMNACAWAVAAALLFWPALPGRWRRSLALAAGLTGVAFLGLAVRTEGVPIAICG